MSLKNWDNKTWLSSKNYIDHLINFLLKQVTLDKNSQILDIGCGRGKILANLASKLKLNEKPIGIDIEHHKDIDKRITFKKIDALKFIKKDNKKYDLILIKQTIHFLKFTEIKKLIYSCKNKLNPDGRIVIFTLETSKNEIPTFLLMKKKLIKSLKRDKKILKFIFSFFPNKIVKKFSFKVKMRRSKYIEMVRNRYISILLSLKVNEISNGIEEIKSKFKKKLCFQDKLICIILSK